MRSGFGWLAVGIALLVTSPAFASDTPEPSDPGRDAQARNLFEAGRKAYDAGDYQGGLGYFERAYEQSPRSGLLFNIGQAAYRLHSDDKALRSFKAYLDQTPLAPNRVEVETRIRELEQGTGPTTPTYVSPEQAARSGSAAPLWSWPSTSENVDNPPPSSEPITKKWWFWTTIGVIVVGGTVAAIAVAS
jgi:tetratricopeptide (TPR) repeat protein